MDIQVRTDHHVRGKDELISFVMYEVLAGLGPCAHRVTTAHVHLSLENAAATEPKALRCLLEVRPSGHAPLAVMHRATTKDDAVRGAVSDMRGVLERIFARLDGGRRRGAATIRRTA
jgi:hypothetical protein